MTLEEFFSIHPCAALGFSGGVDSAYLLYAGLQLGADIHPYYIKSAFQPQFELEDAQRICKQLGVKMTVLETDILSEPQIAENPENRCYYCKSAMFHLLQERARRDGYTVLLDGTNASDDWNDRPGMRALQECAVLSPLRMCGLTKAEIRKRSEAAGLFTWNKPAYACLATRVPVGTEIDHDLLQRIERAENALFQLGFSDFRVRVFHGAARLQFLQTQMDAVCARLSEIHVAVHPYFDTVLLDLNGR